MCGRVNIRMTKRASVRGAELGADANYSPSTVTVDALMPRAYLCGEVNDRMYY